VLAENAVYIEEGGTLRLRDCAVVARTASTPERYPYLIVSDQSPVAGPLRLELVRVSLEPEEDEPDRPYTLIGVGSGIELAYSCECSVRLSRLLSVLGGPRPLSLTADPPGASCLVQLIEHPEGHHPLGEIWPDHHPFGVRVTPYGVDLGINRGTIAEGGKITI
jgi:hypothetical protein